MHFEESVFFDLLEVVEFMDNGFNEFGGVVLFFSGVVDFFHGFQCGFGQAFFLECYPLS